MRKLLAILSIIVMLAMPSTALANWSNVNDGGSLDGPYPEWPYDGPYPPEDQRGDDGGSLDDFWEDTDPEEFVGWFSCSFNCW